MCPKSFESKLSSERHETNPWRLACADFGLQSLEGRISNIFSRFSSVKHLQIEIFEYFELNEPNAFQ